MIVIAWAASSGCAAQQIVVPEPATPNKRIAKYNDLRLDLRTFRVLGTTEDDRTDQMRRSFLEYLGASNAFATIADSQYVYAAEPGGGSPGSLILDASVEVRHTTHRTYVLDALGATMIWPIVPQWGTAQVTVYARAIGPNHRRVWSAQAVGRARYSFIFYSWFRTDALEAAYQAATADAFRTLAADLAMSRDVIYAQLAPPKAKRYAMRASERAPAAAPPPPPPPQPAKPVLPPLLIEAQRDWVVAVMEIRDDHGDPILLQSLSDQVRINLARRSVRVIDRGQQEHVLREILVAAKEDSYAACYDERCQIPLGKALAATHLLRGQVTRFGTRCVLNGELIELKGEVSITAASVRVDCSDEGFLEASDKLIDALFDPSIAPRAVLESAPWPSPSSGTSASSDTIQGPGTPSHQRG